jgi:hypothetical protein
MSLSSLPTQYSSKARRDFAFGEPGTAMIYSGGGLTEAALIVELQKVMEQTDIDIILPGIRSSGSAFWRAKLIQPGSIPTFVYVERE